MAHKWIVCCGPDRYRPSVSSTQHYIRIAHDEGHHILWMNPIPFRSPFSTSSNKRSAWSKIFDKIRTHIKVVRRVKTGYWVWVPFYFPAFGQLFTRINSTLIRMQFFLIQRILGIRLEDSIVWVAPGISFSYLPIDSFAYRVYEAHDLLSDFRTTSNSLTASLSMMETEISRKADVLLAPTPRICNRLNQMVPDKTPILLPHGVDFSHFASNAKPNEYMVKLLCKGLPIAGYFGSLSDSNDKEVFRILAENGFSVVIIGKVLGDYSTLAQLGNIHLIGPVDYTELPQWATGFNVGLLNWVMHEWMQNCFPVKALEYLASGLPVVSCHIPVLKERYPGLVRFALTPEEFLEQCKLAVTEDSEEKRRIRKEAVSQESWESRYDIVRKHIYDS